MSRSNESKGDARLTALTTIVLAVLGSGLVTTWVAPTAWSTFYHTPDFQITVEPEIRSVDIRNTGHAPAHNVRITVRLEGNATTIVSLFSSENATTRVRYDRKAYATLVTFQLQRMGEQASASVTIGPNYPGHTLEVWAQSDETGIYLVKKRGVPIAPEPTDYMSLIGRNVAPILLFLVLLGLSLLLFWRILRIDYRVLIPSRLRHAVIVMVYAVPVVGVLRTRKSA